MATKTSAVVCFTFCIKIVSGYYCDSDKCTDDEYCCGYNFCCKSYKVWDMWYFWCGLLFFMFLLSMCACLWKLRNRGPLLISSYAYSPLNQEPTYVQTCTASAPTFTPHGLQSFSASRENLPPNHHHGKTTSPSPAYAQLVSH